MSESARSGRHLVLLGAGHAHVQVLAKLAEQTLPGTQVTLVAPYPRQMYSGMVPGFMAGHYAIDDCVIPLQPLIERAGVRWMPCSVVGLHAQEQTLVLSDGSALPYHWLSVNTGPHLDRERVERDMPGAREHAMFSRPIEKFAALWPRVADMGVQQPLRITVVGGGAGGVEMALAVRHRLPNSAVTLLSGAHPPVANYPQRVQQRVMEVLKRAQVTVLQDVAVSFQPGAVHLGCGADLACDVPILTIGAQPPAWLADSGLALDDEGFIAVDAMQRSTSHPQVFAAGDVSSRVDRALARSGVYAVRAGPALADNLRAAIGGGTLKAHQPPASTLNILSCGKRYAIASWGPYSAQGRWVWWLKNWIDRRFMARYQA